MTPEIIAHRGYSAKAPENTLAALEAALNHGGTSVEFDVQTAACGTPVLFHDSMLGRTTNGVGPLGRRSLGQLKALDAGSWFGPEFASERVPTLKEALEKLSGRIEHVYQDIKSYREMEDLDRMVAITRDASMAEVSVFVASDWGVLDRLRQKAPEIRRAYLVEGPDTFSEARKRAGEDQGSLLSIEIGLVLSDPEAVRSVLASGVEVVTWTVDDPTDADRALEAGITRITSNEVEALMAWGAGLE